MAASTSLGLRRSFLAVLIVALTLAGLGRALATTAQLAPHSATIAGVHVSICHAGDGPADPAQPVSHGCCDDCALLAPAVLPAPPVLPGPAPVARFAEHAQALHWAPLLARLRTPPPVPRSPGRVT